MAAPSFDRRVVALPDGRTVVIRAITPADTDRLATLYAGLDDDDTYRRFFSVLHPDREFFEQMATIAERGGFGVVAAVPDGGDGERLVAEAGYTLLPDGDGELEITVAKEWRGWLGPYLFDALLSAAAGRGVPNLQADVLVTNRPMLALVRSRGYATLDHPNGTLVRVTVATSGRTPSWSGSHDRPRVLVEAPGGRWHAEEAARAAGLQVIVCPGPGAASSRCPALHGRACPLAAAADAIVLSHAPDRDDRWIALPGAHDELHPGVPVCVELGPAAASAPGRPTVPQGEVAEVVAFVERLAKAKGRQARDQVTIDPSASR